MLKVSSEYVKKKKKKASATLHHTLQHLKIDNRYIFSLDETTKATMDQNRTSFQGNPNSSIQSQMKYFPPAHVSGMNVYSHYMSHHSNTLAHEQLRFLIQLPSGIMKEIIQILTLTFCIFSHYHFHWLQPKNCSPQSSNFMKTLGGSSFTNAVGSGGQQSLIINELPAILPFPCRGAVRKITLCSPPHTPGCMSFHQPDLMQ